MLPGAAVDTVLVLNNVFNPLSLTVAANTTIMWVWPAGSRRHNLVPVAPATVPNSPAVVDGPYSYGYTFTVPGTYRYYCSVHGSANAGMRAQVVVQ